MMEMAVPRPTEVVADSEDEDMLLDPPVDPQFGLANGGEGAGNGIVSSIQTANSTAAQDTSISASASEPRNLSLPAIAILPSASDAISNFTMEAPPAPKPRPKPRPLKKLSPTNVEHVSSSSSVPTTLNTSITTATPDTSIIDPSPMIPAKPRPKPRPSAKPTVLTTLGSIASPSADPIATASSHLPGNTTAIEDPMDFSLDIAERTKMRSRGKPKPVVDQSDVIEISDDELSLLPPKKSKSKKTSVPKISLTKRANISRGDDMSAPESTPNSLPAPTSDFSLHLGSQLPPSDPPLPSTFSIPPLGTPPGAQRPAGRAPSPLSPTIIDQGRKRKRARQTIGSDDDEHNIQSDKLASGSGILMPPPPPPFFASSSSAFTSSAAGPPAGPTDPSVATSSNAAPKKRNTKKRKNADDEDAFNSESNQPKPKVKGRRKKGDSDDEDFGEKPKGKPRKKAAPKTKKPAVQLEVVVDVPPRNRSRTNSKEMAMEIEPGDTNTTGSGEAQPLPPPISKPPVTAAEPPDGGQVVAGGSSKPAPPNKKRKGKESDLVSGAASSEGSKTTKQPSAKARGKRRAIESSDEEAEEEHPLLSNDKSSSRKEPSPPKTNSQSSASSGLGRTGSFKVCVIPYTNYFISDRDLTL
ncbi:hypothetical protein BXZ70DRAFT_201999 [Cristinia sonorae]|uniref:Uncharacterized protein n=1 Tax=Cristinia sonorae TaxID=1940300 RepID=A0A8K0UPS3_9AGAR|nr:hypothetical protein BXZ70DRAFT_201999 [Cristinia sonorae]